MPPKITLYLCPDANGFHGKRHPFYLSVEHGKTTHNVENPSATLIERLLNRFYDSEVFIVYGVCPHCVSRGVKGLTHFTDEEVRKGVKE